MSHKQSPIAVGYHTTREAIEASAKDPFCYPPIDRNRDIFQNHMSFAQRLRSHIEFCLAEERRAEAEDPNQILLY